MGTRWSTITVNLAGVDSLLPLCFSLKLLMLWMYVCCYLWHSWREVQPKHRVLYRADSTWAALLLYKPDMTWCPRVKASEMQHISKSLWWILSGATLFTCDVEFAVFCSTLVFEPKPCHPHCWVEFCSRDDCNLQQQLVGAKNDYVLTYCSDSLFISTYTNSSTKTTLHMVFSITYYLELHGAISFWRLM